MPSMPHPPAETLTYDVARAPWEFEAIHRLNYQTFVEEIPQHETDPGRRRVDPFHQENTYLVARAGRRVVGMMALRDRRPFSLDNKLQDLDRYLPAIRRPCEVRLLSVEPEHRGTRVLYGLAKAATEHCLEAGYDLLLISGVTRQLKLYRHLGFVPFGPLVGSGEARFQPMYLTFDGFREAAPRLLGAGARRPGKQKTACFLPGPVTPFPGVMEALAQPMASHRERRFAAMLEDVRRRLAGMTGARRVSLLCGTGTLANDIVAGQLSLVSGRGVVLANGAFGERLAAHARAWRLDHCVARWPWGEAIDLEDASRALSEPGLSWVWLVHCETSTGVMNDLATVNAMAKRRGLKVAADCISSLGAAPTELRDMDWAAGVSSKGLGAPAGLSFVCHAEEAEPAPDRLPRYLDLGLYDGRNDSPWTFPSNLLTALQAALPHAACAERQATLAEHGRAFQQACRERGLRVLAPEACAAPAVTTLALPASAASCDAARALLGHGATVAWASDYLLERNWIQVCLMGAYDADMLRRLPGLLEEAVAVRA